MGDRAGKNACSDLGPSGWAERAASQKENGCWVPRKRWAKRVTAGTTCALIWARQVGRNGHPGADLRAPKQGREAVRQKAK